MKPHFTFVFLLTLRYTVLSLATISAVAFSADKDLDVKDPLSKYFDSFVASPAEISIKFPGCGQRYLLVSSGGTNRISEYGEIVLLKKPGSLKLTTQGCVLSFLFDPNSIDLFLIKNDLKNLFPLRDFLCIFTQRIDSRSIGKSLEEKTYLLLFADPLSDKIMASIEESNNLHVVYIKKNEFILIEFKAESAGGRSPADDQKHFLSPEELAPFFDTEWSSFYGRMHANPWVASSAIDNVAKKILQCRPSYYTIRKGTEMYPYSIRFVSATGDEKIVFFNFRHFSLDMKKVFPHNITGDEQEKFYWDVYQRDF